MDVAGRRRDGPARCRRSASARSSNGRSRCCTRAPALLVLSDGRPLSVLTRTDILSYFDAARAQAVTRRDPMIERTPSWAKQEQQIRLGVRDARDPRRPGARRRPPARSSRRSRCRRRSPRARSASTRATSTRGRATRPAPRSRPRSPRSKRPATGSRSRAAWRPRTTSCGCSRQGQRVLLGNDAYGGTFRLISKVWSPLGFPWTAVDLGDLDALVAELAGRHRHGVARDADQPAADVLRHRGDRRDRPRTGRDRRGRQHVRHAVPAAADHARRRHRRCTRPRSTSAGTATWSAGSSPSTTTRSPAGCATPRTRPAPCRRRSTATSCSAASKTLGVRMDRHCENARAVVDLLDRPRRGRAGAVPAAARSSRSRRRRQADARLRRHGQLPVKGGEQAARTVAAAHRAVHARRVARRRREPDRAPGRDDPRVGGRAVRSRCRTTWSACRVGIEHADRPRRRPRPSARTGLTTADPAGSGG